MVLNLQYNKPFFVGFLQVFHKVNIRIASVRISSVYGPEAKWVKAGHPDNIFCIIQAHNMRYHNTGGIHFKRFNKVAIAAPGYTNKDICCLLYTSDAADE